MKDVGVCIAIAASTAALIISLTRHNCDQHCDSKRDNTDEPTVGFA